MWNEVIIGTKKFSSSLVVFFSPAEDFLWEQRKPISWLSECVSLCCLAVLLTRLWGQHFPQHLGAWCTYERPQQLPGAAPGSLLMMEPVAAGSHIAGWTSHFPGETLILRLTITTVTYNLSFNFVTKSCLQLLPILAMWSISEMGKVTRQSHFCRNKVAF